VAKALAGILVVSRQTGSGAMKFGPARLSDGGDNGAKLGARAGGDGSAAASARVESRTERPREVASD
jgi:hypothetical protein